MKLGLQAYCGYLQVCVKNGSYWPNYQALLAPNRAKIPQYIGFLLFSWKVSAGLNLIYKLTGTTLVGVWTIGSRGPIFCPFWASKWVKFRFSNILLKSFPWISHQSEGIFCNALYTSFVEAGLLIIGVIQTMYVSFTFRIMKFSQTTSRECHYE